MNETDALALADEAPLVLAQRVDHFISQLHIEQYGRAPTWSDLDPTLVQFVNSFNASEIFPSDRLREATLRMIDVRLQIEYIMFDLGLMNKMLYSLPADGDARPSARTKLRRMALSQSAIGRSRILWERIFRLVYYLENGKDINTKRSVKGYFFRWASASERWRFMEVYAPLVEEFDRQFRTPEFHKHSILRAHVVRGDAGVGPEMSGVEVLGMVNRGFSIPSKIQSVVQTGWNDKFDDLHHLDCDIRKDVTPRYLPPPNLS